MAEQREKKIWEFSVGGIEDLKRLSRQLNAPIEAIEDVSGTITLILI